MRWKDVRAINTKRDVALSKIKGFQPIGIGEASTCLQGKAINLVAGDDIKNECNVNQLSSGAKAGAEAAVHSMKTLFDENSSFG